MMHWRRAAAILPVDSSDDCSPNKIPTCEKQEEAHALEEEHRHLGRQQPVCTAGKCFVKPIPVGFDDIREQSHQRMGSSTWGSKGSGWAALSKSTWYMVSYMSTLFAVVRATSVLRGAVSPFSVTTLGAAGSSAAVTFNVWRTEGTCRRSNTWPRRSCVCVAA